MWQHVVGTGRSFVVSMKERERGMICLLPSKRERESRKRERAKDKEKRESQQQEKRGKEIRTKNILLLFDFPFPLPSCVKCSCIQVCLSFWCLTYIFLLVLDSNHLCFMFQR